MCGIFGLLVKAGAGVDAEKVKKAFNAVARISKNRGSDSSGAVFRLTAGGQLRIVRGDLPVSKLLGVSQYRQALQAAVTAYSSGGAFQAMGHARLVTNGSQLSEGNNQPVLSHDIVTVHNGIIVNDEALWAQHPDLTRHFGIDTEVFNALLQREITLQDDLVKASRKVLSLIEGTVSAGVLFNGRPEVLLITNNGSLYYVLHDNFLVFASEEYFLVKLMKQAGFITGRIRQLKAGQGLIVDPAAMKHVLFSLNDETGTYDPGSGDKLECIVDNVKGTFDKQLVIDPSGFAKESGRFKSLLQNNESAISQLTRCSRCILPETFPFIDFDDKGVCNYCRNYKPQKKIEGLDQLKALVAPYRRNDGRPDCIVPFSGGRDSTFCLHVVKEELGLHPIAFTYDWGMVTDLARRNIARVCGRLGVENIIVSADIRWKRENIRKNIEAWIRKPGLGMVPLFMAGDKYFFYYCEQLKKQTGIDLNIWGINQLENTNFKTGFAGVAPDFNKKRIYSLSAARQLRLFGYVGSNFLTNPSYFNQSMLDSLGSFAARYLAPKSHYYHLFDYYRWNEKEIEGLIMGRYGWETAVDTDSTWRIGDGTASFYNYIYNTVAGFTENDTFRSNQIREGMMSREDALAIIYKENEPRYETLRWYIEILGLDFEKVIRAINDMPKLFSEERYGGAASLYSRP